MTISAPLQSALKLHLEVEWVYIINSYYISVRLSSLLNISS